MTTRILSPRALRHGLAFLLALAALYLLYLTVATHTIATALPVALLATVSLLLASEKPVAWYVGTGMVVIFAGFFARFVWPTPYRVVRLPQPRGETRILVVHRLTSRIVSDTRHPTLPSAKKVTQSWASDSVSAAVPDPGPIPRPSQVIQRDTAPAVPPPPPKPRADTAAAAPRVTNGLACRRSKSDVWEPCERMTERQRSTSKTVIAPPRDSSRVKP